MKKLVFLSVIMGVAGLFSACSSSKKVADVSVLAGEWTIAEVKGEPISAATPQRAPYIGFDMAAKRISGNSGCNRMMGSFLVDSLKPGSLSFTPMASTRMACPDMDTEQKVLAALGEVKSFELLSCEKQAEDAVCKVALCDEQGTQLMLLQKKEVVRDENPLSAIAGEWTFKTVGGEALAESPKAPFIQFDITENRIGGNAGCNSFGGAIKHDEKQPASLSFGPIAATQMACMNMEVERKVFGALDKVKTFKVNADGTAVLYAEDGSELMVLQKK